MGDDTSKDDVSFIRALAELLRETDLTELQVKREEADGLSLNVRVSRHHQMVAPQAAAMPAPFPAQGAMPASGPPATPEDPADHPGAVTSPMVGTVYLQPEPTVEAFAQVGSVVEEGQTLLIIEAMKTMNQIPSPRAGTVRRILVEDGAPVEFGAPLMIIE